jgi:hypothetical protein
MTNSRTGHTGSRRPPGHRYPSERLYHAVAKAISAEARATGKTLEAIVKARIPDAFRFLKQRNGKAWPLDC